MTIPGFLSVIGCAAMAIVASAQTGGSVNMTFSYRSMTSTAPTAISSTGTVQMGMANVGDVTRVTFNVINSDPAAVNITRVTVAGAGFSTNAGQPIQLRPAELSSFEIAFAPTTRGVSSGTMIVEVTSGERRSTFTFFLGGTGVIPELVLSYLLSGGNQIGLAEGGTLKFPETTLGQTASATVFIVNRGNGPASLTRATVEGSDTFRVSGLPLLPVEIAADRDVRFIVTYTPTQRDRSLGTIRLETSSGARLIVLEGTAVAPSFTYQLRYDDKEQNIGPAGNVTVPDTPVGSSRPMRLVVRNAGNLDGRLVTLSISGAAYQFGDLPILPATLAPGRTLDLPFVFAPKEVGPAAGRIRIDSTIIELSGTALGSRLSLTATLDSGAVPVTVASGLTFPNAPLGASVTASFRIENTGNVDASLSGVSVIGGAFQLEQAPAAPTRIAPGEAQTFRVKFVPDAVGALSGTLQVDDQRYQIRGTGTAPEPLSTPSFRLIADTVAPLTQPAVGLSLERPYSLPLTGRLTLAFTSESFSDDQTIQFATGGRTVDFRIPAGSTDAIFGESARQILFQAGTVAGQIAVSATFQYGSVNLTPPTPPSKNVTVARSEPRLRSVQVVMRSSTSMDIIVSGYSTPRSVSRLDFQFSPGPGAQLQTTSLTADVNSAFDSWYQSAGSRAFGSQFSATVTINSTGDLAAVQSVTVTAANGNGVSTPVSTNLR